MVPSTRSTSISEEGAAEPEAAMAMAAAKQSKSRNMRVAFSIAWV